MVRECLIGLVLAQLAGCSLILDFSESAIPIDAQIDAPYTDDECAFMEPNDSADTAMTLTPDVTGPAAICAGASEDHDFYKFTVPPATASVQITISFTNRPTGDLDLRLLDKTGATKLAESRGFGDNETITCPATSPPCAMLAADDYVFEVLPGLTGSVNNYTIALTITPM
jgi:hypothetical protein